jgi:hypothetical protein
MTTNASTNRREIIARVTRGHHLEVVVFDRNLEKRWGLGYVGDLPVVFVSESPYGATVCAATEGDHVVARNGECARVEGGRIAECPGHPRSGDTRVARWPDGYDQHVAFANIKFLK